jgi:type IX secretion system PorP/SprF family membrane protein
MIRTNIIKRFGIAALLLTTPVAFAQDIHFTQFDMQPLVVNPAFTGMFFGKFRINAIYRDQWKSVTVPYKTYGLSFDMPVYTESNGDYLAAGLQAYNDQAGDGNLTNFTGLLSVAYHKTFGGKDENSGADLAVGLQGGYASKSIDLSKLYFGDEFVNGTFVPGTTQEYASGMGNHVSYYLINAGISFAYAANEKFSFAIGLGANNLNQPNDAIEKKKNSDVGLDMRYTAQLGANWRSSDRLSLRPAILYQYQATASEIVAGNEFHYRLSGAQATDYNQTAVFLGGWYRTGDAAMITAGFEYSNIRVGLGYDYNISALNNASNGNGGFELAVKYVVPYKTPGKNRYIPCNRF